MYQTMIQPTLPISRTVSERVNEQSAQEQLLTANQVAAQLESTPLIQTDRCSLYLFTIYQYPTGTKQEKAVEQAQRFKYYGNNISNSHGQNTVTTYLNVFAWYVHVSLVRRHCHQDDNTTMCLTRIYRALSNA